MSFAFVTVKITVWNTKNMFLAFVIAKFSVLQTKNNDLLITKARNDQKVCRDNDPPTGATSGDLNDWFSDKIFW